MNAIEFNVYLRKMKHDAKSFEIMFEYCCGILSRHLIYKFGNKDFIEDVIHEVVEFLFAQYVPDEFINYPAAWLCRIADNRVKTMFAKKDNNSLELIEDYGYSPCFDEKVNVLGENFKKAWDKLDAVSRDIIIMNAVMGYSQQEIAVVLDISYDNVRAKSSRAKKFLRLHGKDD